MGKNQIVFPHTLFPRFPKKVGESSLWGEFLLLVPVILSTSTLTKACKSGLHAFISSHFRQQMFQVAVPVFYQTISLKMICDVVCPFDVITLCTSLNAMNYKNVFLHLKQYNWVVQIGTVSSVPIFFIVL